MRSDQRNGVITGVRPGRMRDRRGRGTRGPMALPGPLSPDGVPAQRTPRQAFDDVVAELLRALDHHFRAEPEDVEVVVEEAPLLPSGWDEPVPLSFVTTDRVPSRVTVYRLPITSRCQSQLDLRDLAWSTVLEGLAEVWNIPAERLDPR